MKLPEAPDNFPTIHLFGTRLITSAGTARSPLLVHRKYLRRKSAGVWPRLSSSSSNTLRRRITRHTDWYSTSQHSMSGLRTAYMRRLVAFQQPSRCAHSAFVRRCWSAASSSSRTNDDHLYRCSRSPARRTTLTSSTHSTSTQQHRVLRRSFVGSALQQVTANVRANRPLQLWLVGGIGAAMALFVFNQSASESSNEVKVWNKAHAALSKSTLATVLHGTDGGRVRLVKGKLLSGYTELTESDAWYELRIVQQADKTPQEGKEAEKDVDGRVLGLYKVRVTARRDKPALPPTLSSSTTKTSTTDAVELHKASPEWQLQSIVVSAPSRQCSFYVDPVTSAVRRADEFLPPTALPSKPPTASTAADGSSTASSSGSIWTLSNALKATTALGTISLTAVYMHRYWRRQQLLSRLKSAVHSSLSTSPLLPLGANARVVRVVSSKITDAMVRAELDVRGDKGGSAGSGRVRVQAVRSSRGAQAGRMSDWQVVHSQLTTSDGRTQQLSLPAVIKS